MTELHERLLSGLPVHARKLHLDGVPTSVLEGGEGPPLVLLHGPNEYAAKWLRVVPALVATHRVIAPDLPGHGRSGPFDGTVDTERVLAWLDALIDRTCSAPPVLCGHILGGGIAARYAANPGHALRRLVLVDPLGLTTFQPVPEFGQALGAFLSEPSEATHDGLWRYCAFDLEKLQTRMGDDWNKIKAYNLDRARVPALKATQHALMEHFGFPAIPNAELHRIAVKTSLIWGRHDLATPLSVAQAASARFGWPLSVIDDCADDPPMEQPEAFVRALYAALESPSGDFAASE
jgi:pimeloyl-ACP methyl ester carboxylesterase